MKIQTSKTVKTTMYLDLKIISNYKHSFYAFKILSFLNILVKESCFDSV